MHCVNLDVQDSLEAVPLMRDLALIHDLISFLRNSPKRCAIVRQIAVDIREPIFGLVPNALHTALRPVYSDTTELD